MSNPHLYEINCRLWLRRLKEKYGRELALDSVPSEEWKRFKELGFDYIWLMGVWKPSERGIEIAASIPELQEDYRKALPSWRKSDIAGSPYAIYSYELNPELGKPEDIKKTREILKQLDLGLILDFVPNHAAVDHPWTTNHPDYFVNGNLEDIEANPNTFFTQRSFGKTIILAHGKDPFFSPWSDTAQLNIFNPDTRIALFDTLKTVAQECDGLRCDMAMLVLNDVFAKTWRRLVMTETSEVPRTEFWKEAISKVKSDYPDFLFIAEVYWGLERKLMELGFDYAYDKVFYEHLREGKIQNLKTDLKAETSYQRRCVRFIENHDEPRSVTAFGKQKSKAAAVMTSTLMGMRFFFEGQLQGRMTRTPIQLARELPEEIDQNIYQHYLKVLHFANDPVLHEGEWTLLVSRSGQSEDDSHSNLFAWMWKLGDTVKIVVVNYSSFLSDGYVLIPLNLGDCTLYDELTGEEHQLREASLKEGLYVRLEPYQSHLFKLVFLNI